MFKVGDKVKVKRFKEVDTEVIERYFLLSMFEYEEAETVVTAVYEEDDDVQLAIDNERNYWHSDMLVKVEDTFKVGDKVKVGKTFKVGDKVKIRKDLEVGEVYGGTNFISLMNEFLGKEATIADVSRTGKFLLDIDDDRFFWSAEMFEPKTYSEDVVEENMVIHKSITVEDRAKPVVHENEVSRLSKAVIEYEDIVHELEAEVDYYENKYIDLVEKYNVLVEKYNSLLDELMEDYIQ